MRVFLAPNYDSADKGEGGVRRVVEAQRKGLPAHGIQVVTHPQFADVIAIHAGEWVSRKINPDAARIFHCHGLYWSGYEWPKWGKDFNQKLIDHAHRADIVTTPSHWVADIFKKEMFLRPWVIPNGIDLPGYLPDPGSYVLYNKAREDAISTSAPLAALAARAPGAKFVSTFYPKAHNVPSNVRVTGPLPHNQALELLARANVYLSTTLEVFSVGVLEALAYGVPVLGYAWGGNEEVIQHKVNGYLARPGDIDDLAEGLAYCQEHREELSREAVETARYFSWDRAIERYAELYRFVGTPGPETKVSVIIPCYNLGQFLGDAVSSVLKQSEPAEIVVVDDCSTDPLTLRVLDSLRGRPDVQVIRTPKNLYLADALNFGFAHATGKYLMALDADNMLPANALALLAGALDSRDDVDCAYGVLHVLAQNDQIIKPNPSWPPETFSIVKQLNRENQVSSTCLFRRSLWERTGGYRQHELLGDDADFWTRAAALGFKFERVTMAPTLIYRHRNDSMTAVSGDRARSYDWTKWTPRHRALMGVSGSPVIPERPRVSVIVNVTPETEDLARDTIESLWPQTFDNWEVIVREKNVLNRPMLPSRQYPPFVRYDTEPRGELLLSLAPGEWLEPDALGLLLAAYDEYPEQGVRFVYSDWNRYDEGDRGFWHVIPTEERGKADLDATVGVVLIPNKEYADPPFAIYLAEPVLNRRNSLRGNIMACMTCGSSRATVKRAPAPAPVTLRALQTDSSQVEGTQLVEFLATGSRTVPVEGTTYRFGEDPEHRVRRVQKRHLYKFQNSNFYKIHEGPAIKAAPETDFGPDMSAFAEEPEVVEAVKTSSKK